MDCEDRKYGEDALDDYTNTPHNCSMTWGIGGNGVTEPGWGYSLGELGYKLGAAIRPSLVA